jgi:hypothetical protein
VVKASKSTVQKSQSRHFLTGPFANMKDPQKEYGLVRVGVVKGAAGELVVGAAEDYGTLGACGFVADVISEDFGFVGVNGGEEDSGKRASEEGAGY